MDFNKLRAFIVVAENLNFRKSADILGMSQPPLSRLISSLEAEVGAQLFERSTRSVKLTGAGVVLLKEAREITHALERIRTDVKIAGKIRNGALKVGFSTTAFLARFPVIIEEFEKLYPKVKLDLQESSTKEILKGVLEKQFDVGFVEGITEFKDLSQHQITEEPMGVLVPKKHPFTQKKEILFSDLKNETLILHHKKEATEFHKRISKLIQNMDQKPNIYIKETNETCPILVATGKGLSLTIKGSQSYIPVKTHFVPIKDMFLPVSIFWRNDNHKEILQTFLSAVIENQSLRLSPTRCLNLLPERP